MKYSFFILYSLLFVACYSFKGTSISPDVQTFYVAQFEDNTSSAVPTLSQDFTERLKDKIRNESRLKFSEEDPDIEFEGTITTYRVTSEAPQPGETTAFNRLTIAVNVEYINNKNEDEGWASSFSYFSNFESNQNLLDVQDQLIADINEQLVEDIFNKAFTNW